MDSDVSQPTAFKTLRCSLLAPSTDVSDSSSPSTSSSYYVLPNSREPIPFETELFKGVCLLLIRSDPLDPFYAKHFEGKKREVEIQVQGTFKRMPEGDLYCGVEVSKKMELSMMMKSVSRIGLKFVQSIVNDLKYSFGDKPSDSDAEDPHIVAPILKGMDRVVITKSGETPPPLGTYLPESAESRKKRMNSNEKIKVDLSCIYSFSVNTTNLHLPSWSIVRIPMLNKLDMRKLVSDADVRLVAYELPSRVKAMTSKHPSKALQYVFSLNLHSVDPLKDKDTIELDSDDENGDDEDDEEEEDVNIAVDASKIERDDDGDEDHDDDDDNDIDGEHDEISASTFNGSKGNSEHPKKNSKRRLVRDWIKKGIRRMLSSSTNLAQTITNRELKVHEKRYDIYVH